MPDLFSVEKQFQGACPNIGNVASKDTFKPVFFTGKFRFFERRRPIKIFRHSIEGVETGLPDIARTANEAGSDLLA